MRKLRYSVATSLDGFIAGPNGEFDWIIMDPAIDFSAFFQQFDTVIMGRKSFEVTKQTGNLISGMQTIVCSKTLDPNEHPKVTIVTDPEDTVSQLKTETGKDIWLFGGGNLCRTLLDAELVDTIEVGLMPVLLGDGIPMVTAGKERPEMKLTKSETLDSGILMLSYQVVYSENG